MFGALTGDVVIEEHTTTPKWLQPDTSVQALGVLLMTQSRRLHRQMNLPTLGGHVDVHGPAKGQREQTKSATCCKDGGKMRATDV